MQLSKKSLAEELAGRLQGQFMSGKFEVGEKLPPEPELMQIFGVGRSTVREAVRILSNMGFLKVRQGAGTFVERLTPPDEPMERRLGRADLHDLDEVRKILEVAIAEKAAERRSGTTTPQSSKSTSRSGATAAARALQACIEADVNFHIALAEATHNEILCELYRSTAAHLKKRFSNIYRDTECLLATQPTRTGSYSDTSLPGTCGMPGRRSRGYSKNHSPQQWRRLQNPRTHACGAHGDRNSLPDTVL
ncbi:MAG: FadR/GntR family transcriptional regulator [Alistipes onderdonkii]